VDIPEEEVVKHVMIAVAAIRPNPHRNFTRNPLREDQVVKLLESIDRTGFWENLVVRESPARNGEYQLAYGHNRLEALRRKRIVEVRLPVAGLNDWDMYQAMRDENETQQEVTPNIAFENVEVGVDLMEKAFGKIGPTGTWEDFNGALGRSAVRARTAVDEKAHGFETARDHWFEQGTIGRRFITEVLEVRRLHGNTINTVIQSHYGQKLEAIERKKAEAKRAAAAAKRARAKAAQDLAEAERLSREAEAEEREADELAAEAKRIGGQFIAPAILLTFENQRQMSDFAAAIKDIGVSKEYHQAAADFVKTEQAYGKKMSRELNLWWYEVSGQGGRDRARRGREEAFKRFRKHTRDGDFKAYLLALCEKVRKLTQEVRVANSAAAFYENEKHREAARKDCQALGAELSLLVENLSGEARTFDAKVNGAGAVPQLK
jgi:hypothetical protein